MIHDDPPHCLPGDLPVVPHARASVELLAVDPEDVALPLQQRPSTQERRRRSREPQQEEAEGPQVPVATPPHRKGLTTCSAVFFPFFLLLLLPMRSVIAFIDISVYLFYLKNLENVLAMFLGSDATVTSRDEQSGFKVSDVDRTQRTLSVSA